MNRIVKNVLAFIAMIALGRLWVEYDQVFLPKSLLTPAFVVMLFVLMSGYFAVVRPKNSVKFGLILSLIVTGIVVLLSIYQHMIVAHDIANHLSKLILISVFTFTMPNRVGFLYKKVQNARVLA